MSQMHSADDLRESTLDRLHKSMRLAGLNGTSMAQQLDVHRNTVNALLRGKKSPDRRTLIAWAFATGVPVEWLESGTDSHNPTPPDDGERASREDAVAELARSKRGRSGRGPSTDR